MYVNYSLQNDVNLSLAAKFIITVYLQMDKHR